MIELEKKPRNSTPLIYTLFDYKKGCDLRDKLKILFNSLSIDNEMNIPDFILAEMVYNFLMTVYNTNKATEKLKNGGGK